MDFGNIIWVFVILSFILQYLLDAIFKLGFIKEIVNEEGYYFKGTDLKRLVSMGCGVLFAYIFNFKILMGLIGTEPNLPLAAETVDYIATGLLLGTGTGFLNDFLKHMKKNRELITEGRRLQNEIIKNNNNDN